MRRLRIFGAHERLALQALSRVRRGLAGRRAAARMKSTGSSGPVRARTPVRSLEEMTRLALRVAAAGADREGGTAACPSLPPISPGPAIH